MKDSPALLQLFVANRAALVEYAAPILGCRMRAEDVVQEAYIRFSAAAEKPERADAIDNPLSYLYRIVRNLALDWSKRFAQEIALPDADQLDKISSKAATAEQALLYRDELRLLVNALAELPDRTRRAFIMHRVEGRTLQEIAGHLDVSVVRAHQLVKDALVHAAKRLDAPHN